MGEYQLTWISEDLAAGRAPMSYDDLDAIRQQGVGAIVNLCGEYCDLHELEENSGFDVYYLPIPDECAPDMVEMEKALTWMAAAVAQGRKVLVHCRFGIGRTGTLIMGYLLKTGMDMKTAEKTLKKMRTGPSQYCQWKLLKKYNKKVKRSGRSTH